MPNWNFTACVVGLGSIGERHLSNLVNLDISFLVGVDPDDKAKHRISRQYGIETKSSLDVALDTYDIDFVVISTPNSLHVPQAKTAASAGCHLFIEKPLSSNMEGVDDLVEKIQSNDLRSLVGCNLRFSPPIRKIRELLNKNIIGPVISVQIQGGSYLPDWYPDSPYQESYSARESLGGGVVFDYIHELNYAHWLFGEFDTVTAVVDQRTQLEIETPDIAAIIANSRSGPLCEFHLDYIQREYSRTCKVIGELGTIEWSWQDRSVKWYTTDDDSWQKYDYSNWDYDQMYIDEMKHFLECLDSNTETICPVTEGRQDLKLALAARKASEDEKHVNLKQ